jgi:hypothetical protein
VSLFKKRRNHDRFRWRFSPVSVGQRTESVPHGRQSRNWRAVPSASEQRTGARPVAAAEIASRALGEIKMRFNPFASTCSRLHWWEKQPISPCKPTFWAHSNSRCQRRWQRGAGKRERSEIISGHTVARRLRESTQHHPAGEPFPVSESYRQTRVRISQSDRDYAEQREFRATHSAPQKAAECR